tara:strand:+ start:2005 stop:2706 length:702 start_codon:yes stop_codon:yes gene_type:complete
MTKKILAIIPARAGSKGLQRKNVIDLAGKPLIAWSIEASLKSKYISKTLVSSDDNEILNISKKYGADTLKRPDEFATDISSSEQVISHALNAINETYDYVILLQPTSPLRDVDDIDNAFKTFFSTDAKELISTSAIDNKILKAFKEKTNGFIEGISNNEYPFMRRQNLPKTFMSNGAIYIIKTDEFLKSNSFFTDKTISYLMDDMKSLDIDTLNDLEKIKKYIEINNKKRIKN